MRRVLWAALAALFFCGTAWAQGTQFGGDVIRGTAVIPGASVRVCTAAATGTPCTPLATIYSDLAMTSVDADSIVTADSAGRYTYYAPAGCYKEQISAAGFSTSTITHCEGAAIANSCSLSFQSVAGAAAKWLACYNAMPVTGGTVLNDLVGSQPIASDVFVAATAKPIHNLYTSGQYSLSVSTTIPANITTEINNGAKLDAPNGVTVTVNGPFDAPPTTVLTWAGTGKFVIKNPVGGMTNVRWWGALGDNSTNDTAAFQAMITNCSNVGGGSMFVPQQTAGTVYRVPGPITFAAATSGWCNLFIEGDVYLADVTDTTGNGWSLPTRWRIEGRGDKLSSHGSYAYDPQGAIVSSASGMSGSDVITVTAGPNVLRNLKLLIGSGAGRHGINLAPTSSVSNFKVENVTVGRSGSQAGSPLVVSGIQWFTMRDSSFVQSSAVTDPTILITSPALGTNVSVFTVEGVTIAGQAIKLNAYPNNLNAGGMTFSRVVYENGNDDGMFIIDTKPGANAVAWHGLNFIDCEAADVVVSGGAALLKSSPTNDGGVIDGVFVLNASGFNKGIWLPAATGPQTISNFVEIGSKNGAADATTRPITQFTGYTQLSQLGVRTSQVNIEGSGKLAVNMARVANVVATPSASGGSLGDGTYYMVVTALDADGNQTYISLEKSAVVSGGGGSGKIELTWDAVPGAVSYRVYGPSGTAGGGLATGYFSQNKPKYGTSTTNAFSYTAALGNTANTPIYTADTGNAAVFKQTSTGGTSIVPQTVGQLNNIIFVDGKKYTTIEAALTAAEAMANGGTVVVPPNYTETITAPLTVGTATKPVTLYVDRSAVITVNVTSGSDAIQVYSKSAIIADGPNALDAQITLASTANVSSVIASYPRTTTEPIITLQGLTVKGHASATVTSALVDLLNVTDLSSFRDLVIWNVGNTVGLKIATSGSLSSGPLDFFNITVNGGGMTGAKPLLVSAAGAIIADINFYGGTFGHPGPGGLVIADIEGTAATAWVNFYGTHFESTQAADIGVLINNAAVSLYDAVFTAGAAIGADCVKITGTSVVNIHALKNQAAWTNTLNNVAASYTISAATNDNLRSYVYTGNASRTQDVVFADVNGVQVQIDSNGLTTKKLANYNSIATVSNGVPTEYAQVNLTAQGAAISATTLYAVPAAGAGQYRICFDAKVTQAATTSSVLGGTNGFQIVYTDQDDSVVTTTVAGHPYNSTVVNLALNTTQAFYSGCLYVNAKASTNIQYSMDYTSVGATPMQYNLHIRLEAM